MSSVENWNAELAAELPGKTVLVGITYTKADGTNTDDQFFGEIVSATPNGILLSLRGERTGQEWNMPPMLDGLRPANPGNYRLKSTGEEVVDPDFTMVWTVRDADN
jgi:hypothetical protein